MPYLKFELPGVTCEESEEPAPFYNLRGSELYVSHPDAELPDMSDVTSIRLSKVEHVPDMLKYKKKNRNCYQR